MAIVLDANDYFDRLEVDLKEAVADAIEIGLEAIMEDVLDQTQVGNSPVTRSPFTPYSDKYRKYKERMLGSANPVNLRYDGSISDYAIEIDAQSTSGELYFKGTTRGGLTTGEAMYLHQTGGGTMPVRKIFPESIQDIPEEVLETIRQRILNRINNA